MACVGERHVWRPCWLLGANSVEPVAAGRRVGVGMAGAFCGRRSCTAAVRQLHGSGMAVEAQVEAPCVFAACGARWRGRVAPSMTVALS